MILTIRNISQTPVTLPASLTSAEATGPLKPGTAIEVEEKNLDNETGLALMVLMLFGYLHIPLAISRLTQFQKALINHKNGSEPANPKVGDAIWSTTDGAVRIFTGNGPTSIGGGEATGFLGSGWLTVGKDIWSIPEDMPIGLVAPSVVALRDGRIMTVGGIISTQPSATVAGTALTTDRCFIFSPATGSWQEAARMPGSREGMGVAVLLDGKVLAVGGVQDSDLVANFKDDTYLYDPVTDAWTDLGAPGKYPAPTNWDFTYNNTCLVTLKDGKVLAVGGMQTASGDPDDLFSQSEIALGTDTGAVFDPGAGTWTPAGNVLSVDLAVSQLSLLPDGRVFITGERDRGPTGDDVTQISEACHLYDPTTNLFSVVASMPIVGGEDGANNPGNRSRHLTVVLQDGRVVVFGGLVRTGAAGVLAIRSSCAVYNPQTNVWGLTAPSPLGPRAFLFGGLLPDGRVLAIGGIDNDFVNVTGAIYDPGASGTGNAPPTDSWAPAASLPIAGSGAEVFGIPVSFVDTSGAASFVNSGQYLYILGGIKSLQGINFDFPLGGFPDTLPGNRKTLVHAAGFNY